MPEPISAFSAVASVVGKEAAKPISALAEALAQPWVARLRRWATDRELQQRLEDPELTVAFSSYARRLLERVSSLSTVISRDPLPLTIVYEPLFLVPSSERTEIPNAELRREGARFFIVDGAGMGKSTFARNLIVEAVEAEDLVPVLLELRRVDRGVSLAEAIAREFDDLDRQFDRDLLLRLFVVGRFLFVLDGLDEVATDQRQSLLGEIEDLAGMSERSAIVLTTRPETALPSIPSAHSATIRPLTRGQSESLVRRYDRALGGLELGERLIAEFSAVPDRFLRTPLLVALLYRTFGYTHSISTRVSIFYDELYNALYKGHDLTKSGYVRPKASGLDVGEFRRLVRGFSFLMIAHQKTSLRGETEAWELASEASRLTSVTCTSPTTFVEDLLSAVPLLVREGLELRFVHKSIAEFFAAEYLGVGNPLGDEMINDIIKGPLIRRFAAVYDFLADIDPPLFVRAVVAPLAESAFRFEPEEQDELLRTLRYLADVKLSCWPANKIDSITSPFGPEHRRMIPVSGFIHEQEYYLIAAFQPTRVPPSFVVWKFMTEALDNFITQPRNFESFCEIFMPNEWVDLYDSRIVNAMEVQDFRVALTSLLMFLQHPDPFWYSEEQEPRVLSQPRLEEITRSAREDRAARESVRNLLTREESAAV